MWADKLTLGQADKYLQSWLGALCWHREDLVIACSQLCLLCLWRLQKV